MENSVNSAKLFGYGSEVCYIPSTERKYFVSALKISYFCELTLLFFGETI
jgi:hypothetical protein